MQEGGVEKLWKYVDNISKYLISEGTVENAGVTVKSQDSTLSILLRIHQETICFKRDRNQ